MHQSVYLPSQHSNPLCQLGILPQQKVIGIFSNLSQQEVIAIFSNLPQQEVIAIFSNLPQQQVIGIFSNLPQQEVIAIFSCLLQQEVIAIFSNLLQQEVIAIFRKRPRDKQVKFQKQFFGHNFGQNCPIVFKLVAKCSSLNSACRHIPYNHVRMRFLNSINIFQFHRSRVIQVKVQQYFIFIFPVRSAANSDFKLNTICLYFNYTWPNMLSLMVSFIYPNSILILYLTGHVRYRQIKVQKSI